eukprot:6342368-Heterocapsa_arctica.AAC.1
MMTPWTKFNVTRNWLEKYRNKPPINKSERTPNWQFKLNIMRGTLPLHLEDHQPTPLPRRGKGHPTRRSRTT